MNVQIGWGPKATAGKNDRAYHIIGNKVLINSLKRARLKLLSQCRLGALTLITKERHKPITPIMENVLYQDENHQIILYRSDNGPLTIEEYNTMLVDTIYKLENGERLNRNLGIEHNKKLIIVTPRYDYNS